MESILQYLSYLLLFLLVTFLFIKWLVISPNPQNTLPPSPPKLPIIGNLHQLSSNYPHRSLHGLAQRYGSLMLLRFGSKPVLVVSSANACQEILKTYDHVFLNRASIGVVNKVLYQGKDIASASYGEYWRKMRNVCNNHLLGKKRVKSFENVREEEIELLVEKIDEFALKNLPMNLSEIIEDVTNDITSRITLGRKYRGNGIDDNKFRYLFEELTRVLGNISIGDFIPWLSWVNKANGFDSRVDRFVKELDEFLDGVVEDHMTKQSNAGEEDDIVDTMLHLQKDYSIGIAIHRDNIKGVLLDVFAGGAHTTSAVLEWSMTELIRNPKIMKRIQNEVRGITKNRKQATENDLEHMHYLKAVIKETLRLYPPFPLLVPRKSTQDVKINGYDIAAETIVYINAWAIGRDPAKWDEPNNFLPERFLNSSIDFRGQDFELIPFGAGRRMCPGISFAMVVDELVLANLVNRFDWSLPDGVHGEDLNMNEGTGVIIHRQVPLYAIATSYFGEDDV